jgi:hypothetical protein
MGIDISNTGRYALLVSCAAITSATFASTFLEHA